MSVGLMIPHFLKRSSEYLRPLINHGLTCSSLLSSSSSSRFLRTGPSHEFRKDISSLGVGGVSSPSKGLEKESHLLEASEILDGSREIEDGQLQKETLDSVNDQIREGNHGRLFAVVHLRGHQHKVTSEDLFKIQDDLEVNVGTQILLDKVLLVGGSDFTLLGRPMLPRDLVRVSATVVEKTLSEIRVRRYFQKRSNYSRTKISRKPHTTLRINDITFTNLVGETSDLAGFLGNNIITQNNDSIK